MAAPALSSRAGSVNSLGSSPTASGAGGKAPHAYPELDFRSGARMEELNRLIQEFSKHDQREYDDQRALEIHTAKDFIFSMLGMVQKLDQKLPVANEYLLLSGGVREGVVDMALEELGVYARGADYDVDFTLLVPALKLHDRNQPVTLDMRHSPLCHSWLSLRLFDEATVARWRDCCTVADHASAANYFFSPTLVADWFHRSVAAVLQEVRRKPQRGTPRVERVERHGTVVSVVLGAGGSRVLYDVVPVVSFKGWPAVAQGWLMENHFWDGKITEEEVIGGFYLLPACSSGGRRDNEWRLSFARSEVQLKKCIPPGLMQAYQACKAMVSRLLQRPPGAVGPYHLRSAMLWACDRLPAGFLAQDELAGHFLLGLLDDLLHCLVSRCCPNYFLPQCNMLEGLAEAAALQHARTLSSVRADPAEHLRSAVQAAAAAGRLAGEGPWRGAAPAPGGAGPPSPQSDASGDSQPDDRLAKKLQQLVTENPGKSISVFINPDDVARPHFRIDDKFF